MTYQTDQREKTMSEENLTEKFFALFEKEWTITGEKIKSELEPFLNSLRAMDTSSRNFKLFKQAYSYFENKHKRAGKIVHTIFQAERISSRKVKDVVYMLFIYLGVIESIGNSIVNILVMLLIANGMDFHIERAHDFPRIKHAASIRELEKERVPLTTKLNFLKYNGITELTSIIDSKLRNTIAHLKFDLKENDIYIRGKPAFVIAFLSAMRLNRAIVTTEMLLKQLAEETGLTAKD